MNPAAPPPVAPPTRAAATLQISLSPADLRYARHTVPHQIRQWGPQVAEVLLTVDAHRSGWFAEPHTPGAVSAMEAFTEACRALHAGVRVVEVDYSRAMIRQVSDEFFGGRTLPLKDYKGTPIFPYFFSLHAAANDYVLHADADMMFGGGDPGWLDAAVALLRDRPEVLTCSPLPGAPTHDGRLRSQPVPYEAEGEGAYRFHSLSSRVFVVDRRKLARHSPRLQLKRPPRLRSVAKALVNGQSLHECVEDSFSRMMAADRLARIDLLGAGAGMWSLHPPVRSERFYDLLPELIRAVEAGELPERQRGEFDLREETLDALRASARPASPAGV